jgi:hypothetical protein
MEWPTNVTGIHTLCEGPAGSPLPTDHQRSPAPCVIAADLGGPRGGRVFAVELPTGTILFRTLTGVRPEAN